MEKGDNLDSTVPMEVEHEHYPKHTEEYALTVGRYDEVIKACKCLRARLLFTKSCVEGSKQEKNFDTSGSNLSASMHKAEENMHLVGIQEEALKLAKVSNLAAIAEKKGIPEDIASLMKQHAAFQALIAEKAKELAVAKEKEFELKKQVAVELSDFIHMLQTKNNDLQTTDSVEDPANTHLINKCKRQVKDIRFMQILISELISQKKVDLREDETLRNIVKAVRDPITSVDQFF